MMNAVSHALIELLRRDVLCDAVPVASEAPNRPWTQGAVRPRVDLFLYDVRENLTRREVMLEPVRDSSGVVVGRRTPPTRYDLHYVLSVWGCPVELEYQLLSALVVGLGAHSVLPPELFEQPDVNAPASLLTTAAGMKRGMLPMFSGELKMQVELTVATPVPASATTFVVGPPVREPARIGVLDQSPDDIAARGKVTARMPHPRVAQDDPRAATRAAIAAAVAALPPPPPPKPPAPAAGPPGAARPPAAARQGAPPRGVPARRGRPGRSARRGRPPEGCTAAARTAARGPRPGRARPSRSRAGGRESLDDAAQRGSRAASRAGSGASHPRARQAPRRSHPAAEPAPRAPATRQPSDAPRR